MANEFADLIKAGAADYLSKPWDDKRLIATVRNLLELGQSNQPIAQGHQPVHPARSLAYDVQVKLQGADVCARSFTCKS